MSGSARNPKIEHEDEHEHEHDKSGSARCCSVVLDVVSLLEPDGQAIDVDYDDPPDADPGRGAWLELLA